MEKRKVISAGRVRPFALGLLVLIAGLVLEKWWWQVGLMIMVAVFIEAYSRYRTSD